MKKLIIIINIILITMSACFINNKDNNNRDLTQKINQNLTSEEERIIFHKGTEAPFSGKYWNHFENGTYVCKNCGKELYKSKDKFNSSCGWPSFDDEIPNAIKRLPDTDGRRTEILCNNCGAHLGHIFEGERLTNKNIRHCVNSLSINFIEEANDKNLERAIFAAGCFWGVEALFKNLEGVINTKVGYTGGKTSNPSYEEVCSGNSGHYEAIEVYYNPKKISYLEIVKYFFEIHDFSQENGQGPDIGEQYLSVIFYESNKQKEVAESVIKILQDKKMKVATKLLKAKIFYPAEDYHQNYYQKKGTKPYCHIWKKIF